MKILMIDNAKGWGGAEEQFLALAKGLISAGHAVTLGIRAGSTGAVRLSDETLPIWAVPRGGLKGAVALANFVVKAKQEQFHVIHVHRDHDLPVGKLYALAAGALLILTQHCRPGKPSRLMYGLVDKIVCVSKYIAADICTRLPSLTSRVCVIHNGIDLTSFDAPDPAYWQRHPKTNDRWPLLGAVGCFYKNQEELLGLLPELRKEFPKIALLLIGEDDQKKPALVNRATELGVTDAVVFTGLIPREQMKDALAGLDLQVSAFRNEGFGLAIVEGLAVGTPFVGYRSGGYPEIVTDCSAGFLADSSTELADAVISMLSADSKSRSARVEACVATIGRFSLSRMVGTYEATYASLKGVS
ncbi:MAG: glycosyltransferase family 4 protein [Deltaproteobacteria bacterium]|nr:glycosyltransferase family 4 protein [Deltaproteobacteria bacterium]